MNVNYNINLEEAIKCNTKNRDMMMNVIEKNKKLIKYNDNKVVKGACPICYDELEESRVILNCEHQYCVECFTNHSRLNNKCPMCRYEFGKKPKTRQHMEIITMNSILDNYMQRVVEGMMLDDYTTKIKCDGMTDAEEFTKDIIKKTCRSLGIHIMNWYAQE